jgi:hypothetical protein
MIGAGATDGILDLVEGGDAQGRLVDDRGALLRFGLDQLAPPMRPAEGQPQRIATGAL